MFTYLIVGITAGVLADIVFILLSRYFFRIRNFIINTPTKKIDSITEGPVELKGKVESPVYLTSPLSRKDCVYYCLEVKELRSNGKSNNWVTIKRDKKTMDFLLNDGSLPRAKITFKGASIRIKTDDKFSSGLFHELPENVKKLLEEMNIHTRFLSLNRTLRVEESYLEPEDEVYVLGYARKIEDKENRAWFQIGKEKGFPFIVSDQTEKEIQQFYNTLGFVFAASAIAVIIAILLVLYFNLPALFNRG